MRYSGSAALEAGVGGVGSMMTYFKHIHKYMYILVVTGESRSR